MIAASKCLENQRRCWKKKNLIKKEDVDQLWSCFSFRLHIQYGETALWMIQCWFSSTPRKQINPAHGRVSTSLPSGLLLYYFACYLNAQICNSHKLIEFNTFWFHILQHKAALCFVFILGFINRNVSIKMEMWCCFSAANSYFPGDVCATDCFQVVDVILLEPTDSLRCLWRPNFTN